MYESNIKSLELVHKGKVRDVYRVDADHLLIVTTDRLSAFDVILPDPIPGKGTVLSEISNFWFAMFDRSVPNHLTGIDPRSVVDGADEEQQVQGRAVVTKALQPLPIEAICRGYIIGSGWKEYQQRGSVCGVDLPDNLPQAGELPEPIFTPSTKAAVGDHDENISFDRTVDLIGRELAEQVRAETLKIYREAARYARTRGIVIADTKFEFGLDEAGTLHLIDEVLTPDSSRFWPIDEYREGISPPSFDKQFVRDYLESIDWDKSPPAPRLPAEIIEKTASKYREAATRLIRSE